MSLLTIAAAGLLAIAGLAVFVAGLLAEERSERLSAAAAAALALTGLALMLLGCGGL